MSDYYIKQEHEDVDGLTTYYVHYHDGYPIRQLEINCGRRFKLTNERPSVTDQSNKYFPKRELSTIAICMEDMECIDFITESEFEEAWNN